MADLTEKKESEKHIMDKKTTKKEKHTEINTQKQKTQPKKQQQQQKQKNQQQNKKKAKKKAEVSLGETYSSPNWYGYRHVSALLCEVSASIVSSHAKSSRADTCMLCNS